MALDQTVARADSTNRGSARAWVRNLDLIWVTLAATIIPVSLIWDFSWESTIGVDRFWSPPHIATHAGVWLAGLIGLRLVLAFTLAHQQGGPAAGVRVLGLRGPAGAWVLLWGAGTMLAAFLLDGWWQQAYGLGAGIWSPPQLLKTAGFFALLCGGLLLCAGARSSGADGAKLAGPLLNWHGGLLLTMCAVILVTRNYPNWQHGASFHLISCAVYPAILVAAGRASASRWGATSAALSYMIVWGAMVWLLPLFPARPLAAPIHNPTDHMLPPPFPLLLVLPAVVMDLIRSRVSLDGPSRGGILAACGSGVGFAVVFIPVQWFFARFLLSPSSDHWVFAGGGRHWPFFLKIDQARTLFWDAKTDALTWQTALVALGLAMVSAWIGHFLGGWLRRLQR